MHVQLYFSRELSAKYIRTNVSLPRTKAPIFFTLRRSIFMRNGNTRDETTNAIWRTDAMRVSKNIGLGILARFLEGNVKSAPAPGVTPNGFYPRSDARVPMKLSFDVIFRLCKLLDNEEESIRAQPIACELCAFARRNFNAQIFIECTKCAEI